MFVFWYVAILCRGRRPRRTMGSQKSCVILSKRSASKDLRISVTAVQIFGAKIPPLTDVRSG